MIIGKEDLYMIDATLATMADPVSTVQTVASSLATQKTATEVGTALLANALDTQKIMGDETVRIMENSVTPHIGGGFDDYA